MAVFTDGWTSQRADPAAALRCQGAIVTEPQRRGADRPPSPLAYASLGFEVVLPVALLAYGGYWLDNRAGTLPLFLILGVLLGMAAGFYNLFRRVNPTRKGPNGKNG